MSANMTAGFGFGCQGSQGDSPGHSFLVIIPRASGQAVTVVEDYGVQSMSEVPGERVLRASIERPRWDLISEAVRVEFNRRLRGMGRKVGRWTTGEVPVERLLGKELVLLAWGTEDAPLERVPHAIANWLGFKPEERWWLYSTAAAATGDALRDRGVGWRRALVVALTENPVSGVVAPTMRARSTVPKKSVSRSQGDDGRASSADLLLDGGYAPISLAA